MSRSTSWSLSLPSSVSRGTHALTTRQAGGPFVTVVSRAGPTAGTYESVSGTITLDQVDLRYGGGRVQGSIQALLSGGDSGARDAGLDATFFAEFR